MANKQLTDFLTAENELNGQEPVYIAQNGKTRKTLLQKIKDFAIGTSSMGTTATDVTGAVAELKESVDLNTSQLNAKANKTNAEFTGIMKLNGYNVVNEKTEKKLYSNSELLNGATNEIDEDWAKVCVTKKGGMVQIYFYSVSITDFNLPILNLPDFCNGAWFENENITVVEKQVYIKNNTISRRLYTFIDN